MFIYKTSIELCSQIIVIICNLMNNKLMEAKRNHESGYNGRVHMFKGTLEGQRHRW